MMKAKKESAGDRTNGPNVLDEIMTIEIESTFNGFLFDFTYKDFLKTRAREGIQALIDQSRTRLQELLNDSLAIEYCMTQCDHFKITPFHSIAFVNCTRDLAKMILSIGIDINQPVTEKTTAWGTEVEPGSRLLHMCAIRGRIEMTDLLLKTGADAAALTESQFSPLYLACIHNQAGVVSTLIAGGASPDWRRPHDNATLLHCATDSDCEMVCARLLKLGASLTATNKCGHTPLHVAAKHGFSHIVELFVKNNAVIDQANRYYMETALHKACQYGHTHVAVYLLDHGANMDAVNRFGFTPLMKAVERGHGDTAEMLLIRNAAVHFTATGSQFLGQSVVHLAVISKRVDILYFLLDKNVDFDKPDGYQRTPLLLAVELGACDPASLLCRHGASVNAADLEGNSPLHVASAMDNAELVGMLLDRNARVNAKNAKGQTPLHLAVKADAMESAILLLGAFAKPQLHDKEGKTCNDLASPQMKTVIAKNAKFHR